MYSNSSSPVTPITTSTTNVNKDQVLLSERIKLKEDRERGEVRDCTCEREEGTKIYVLMLFLQTQTTDAVLTTTSTNRSSSLVLPDQSRVAIISPMHGTQIHDLPPTLPQPLMVRRRIDVREAEGKRLRTERERRERRFSCAVISLALLNLFWP